MPKSPASLPFSLLLPADTICARRADILRRVLAAFPVLRHAPPPELPGEALPFMLRAYDEVFLNGYLGAQRIAPLCIAASVRMTRAAGTCTIRRPVAGRPQIEIRMGIDFLFRLSEGPFTVNGLCFDTPLEAFLCVLEHELCHALDFLLRGVFERHGPHFKALSKGLFGHTACTHALPTRAQEAAAAGIGVGQWVTFPYEDKMLHGRVSRVGKTASVMVPDRRGGYADVAGQRYSKFTVPLSVVRREGSVQ